MQVAYNEEIVAPHAPEEVTKRTKCSEDLCQNTNTESNSQKGNHGNEWK